MFIKCLEQSFDDSSLGIDGRSNDTKPKVKFFFSFWNNLSEKRILLA